MTAKTAKIDKRRGKQNARPLTANERNGRKRSGRNSGKALQKKVVGKGGDGGGGWGEVIGGDISSFEARFGVNRDGGGGIVRVREARFDEPGKMARV